MQLRDNEKAAVNRLAKAMVFADNEINPTEVETVKAFNIKYDIEFHMGDTLKVDEALNILAGMNDTNKRQVCCYLGTLMASDGDVADKECLLWSLLSARCGFPEMTVVEAVEGFKAYFLAE